MATAFKQPLNVLTITFPKVKLKSGSHEESWQVSAFYKWQRLRPQTAEGEAGASSCTHQRAGALCPPITQELFKRHLMAQDGWAMLLTKAQGWETVCKCRWWGAHIVSLLLPFAWHPGSVCNSRNTVESVYLSPWELFPWYTVLDERV